MIILKTICMGLSIVSFGLLIYNYQKVCNQLEHYKLREIKQMRDDMNDFYDKKNYQKSLFSLLGIREGKLS